MDSQSKKTKNAKTTKKGVIKDSPMDKFDMAMKKIISVPKEKLKKK